MRLSLLRAILKGMNASATMSTAAWLNLAMLFMNTAIWLDNATRLVG